MKKILDIFSVRFKKKQHPQSQKNRLWAVSEGFRQYKSSEYRKNNFDFFRFFRFFSRKIGPFLEISYCFYKESENDLKSLIPPVKIAWFERFRVFGGSSSAVFLKACHFLTLEMYMIFFHDFTDLVSRVLKKVVPAHDTKSRIWSSCWAKGPLSGCLT